MTVEPVATYRVTISGLLAIGGDGFGTFAAGTNRLNAAGFDLEASVAYASPLDKMTTHDYNMVMKGVGIAELKARLSQHLREVRKGRSLTVLDRDTPVARIVPYTAEPLEIRRATRALRDLESPPPPASPTNSLTVLLDDRRRR